MRFIPTRTHGMLDYLMGILLLIAPWVFGFAQGGAETWVPVILGAGVLLYSLFTNYEMGGAPARQEYAPCAGRHRRSSRALAVALRVRRRGVGSSPRARTDRDQRRRVHSTGAGIGAARRTLEKAGDRLNHSAPRGYVVTAARTRTSAVRRERRSTNRREAD